MLHHRGVQTRPETYQQQSLQIIEPANSAMGLAHNLQIMKLIYLPKATDTARSRNQVQMSASLAVCQKFPVEGQGIVKTRHWTETTAVLA